MSSNPGPQSGVNSWLEEELLQQYQRDRLSVGKDWKEVFEHNVSNGNGTPVNGTPANGLTYAGSSPVSVMPKGLTEPELSGSEELMPLRGAPARIAENMAAS